MLIAKRVTRIPWLAGALIFTLSGVNLLLIKQNFSLRKATECRWQDRGTRFAVPKNPAPYKR